MAGLSYYPAEVATPPLALVALLGCPGLHGAVGEFLRAAHKPPINSLGIADPAMAGRLFGTQPLPAPWYAPYTDRTLAGSANWLFGQPDGMTLKWNCHFAHKFLGGSGEDDSIFQYFSD